VKQFADMFRVSHRTVQGWEGGRPVYPFIKPFIDGLSQEWIHTGLTWTPVVGKNKPPDGTVEALVSSGKIVAWRKKRGRPAHDMSAGNPFTSVLVPSIVEALVKDGKIVAWRRRD
jgi:hypothetical protein